MVLVLIVELVAAVVVAAAVTWSPNLRPYRVFALQRTSPRCEWPGIVASDWFQLGLFGVTTFSSKGSGSPISSLGVVHCPDDVGCCSNFSVAPGEEFVLIQLGAIPAIAFPSLVGNQGIHPFTHQKENDARSLVTY